MAHQWVTPTYAVVELELLVLGSARGDYTLIFINNSNWLLNIKKDLSYLWMLWRVSLPSRNYINSRMWWKTIAFCISFQGISFFNCIPATFLFNQWSPKGLAQAFIWNLHWSLGSFICNFLCGNFFIGDSPYFIFADWVFQVKFIEEIKVNKKCSRLHEQEQPPHEKYQFRYYIMHNKSINILNN